MGHSLLACCMLITSASVICIGMCSSVNGVKEMPGYRVTFNISYTLSLSSGENGTEQCSSSDDVETSALLVCMYMFNLKGRRL